MSFFSKMCSLKASILLGNRLTDRNYRKPKFLFRDLSVNK